MITFGLDSAGRTAAVGVMRDDALLYEAFLSAGHTHSEVLMELVDGAFKATGLSPAGVDLWGVCAGPGSFTGLRIGLATVKGLALVHGAPCAAVSTLEALAFGCPAGKGAVLAALDARRGEVYWAAFDLESRARLAPDAASPVKELAQFVENCKKPLFFVGDGAALCYNKYGQLPGVLPVPPALAGGRAAAVALVARRMALAGQAVLPEALLPDYHRLSQAERERAAKLAAEQKDSAAAT